MGSPLTPCAARPPPLQAPIKGLNKPYDPHNFDPEFSQEYGGFSEGAAGAAAAVSIGSLAGMAAGLTRG